MCTANVLSLQIEKTLARVSVTVAIFIVFPTILISDGGGGFGKPRTWSCTVSGGASIALMKVAEAVP